MIDNGNPRTIPNLVIRGRTTKPYAATATSKTGGHQHAVHFFVGVGVMRELGWSRHIFRCDGACPLCALKTAVRDAVPDVEMIRKESLVGGHPADGEAGNAIKEVKRQVRVLKSSLEEMLQQHISAFHPILTWLPRHGAKCLTRYRTGEDGKTAEQRSTGKRFLQPAHEFGERIHLRPALAQEPRSGHQAGMIEGHYVGRSRTGSILATSEGISKGRGFDRMSLEERWDLVQFENLNGTQRQLKERRAAVARHATPAVGEVVPLPMDPEIRGELFKQNFYVLRGDVVRLGATDGCVACANLILGNRVDATNSTTCKRVECKYCWKRTKWVV